ncbi:sure-like protein [Fomitopsis serialis]|uniref:sure-like protein n=1 Tax=Fomitopsis serialis TaxID=139415 RepID=UPI00200890A8|nr:sure-like protein [Neoantrodia serialis]XP_047891184.1 sure-like protein [Neoantrodia serialis]KAH9915343.1 sure-like protein [Neoantrodia serialis]KAH9922166.1 sure-like protein [Neoantrodia serialis]
MYHPLVAQAALAVSFLAAATVPRNLVLSNDDGWATAQIRAQFDALVAAGYEVILSAPALNQSGKGSRSKTPSVLDEPCEFDTCPVGSPAEGFNASDPRLNYVNAYPVDAARYGVQTLSRQFFDGSSPDFVVSGPNIGREYLNVGISTQFSGTVGAAAEASKLGIPAVAFSGASGSHVSYTTLVSSPTSTSALAANIYANLTIDFLRVLFNTTASPLLPPGVILNVNYPSATRCPDPAEYRWVLARNLWNPFATDVEVCGSARLPTEADVVANEDGCYASVTVISATTKTDVGRATQAAIVESLEGLPLSCMD